MSDVAFEDLTDVAVTFATMIGCVLWIILAHFPAHCDIRNARELLQTIREAEITPPSRQCKGHFLVWGAPSRQPREISTQAAAPRTADSMGTCLAGPIILNHPSGRGSLRFQSRRSKKFPGKMSWKLFWKNVLEKRLVRKFCFPVRENGVLS